MDNMKRRKGVLWLLPDESAPGKPNISQFDGQQEDYT